MAGLCGVTAQDPSQGPSISGEQSAGNGLSAGNSEIDSDLAAGQGLSLNRGAAGVPSFKSRVHWHGHRDSVSVSVRVAQRLEHRALAMPLPVGGSPKPGP